MWWATRDPNTHYSCGLRGICGLLITGRTNCCLAESRKSVVHTPVCQTLSSWTLTTNLLSCIREPHRATYAADTETSCFPLVMFGSVTDKGSVEER